MTIYKINIFKKNIMLPLLKIKDHNFMSFNPREILCCDPEIAKISKKNHMI